MRLVVYVQYMLHGKLGITLRGREALVAEQLLNGPQVRSFFQHVGAESVTQGVRVHIGRESFGHRDLLYNAPHAATG